MILGSQKQFRTRIQEVLLKYGIKQVDVARQTGVHHSTLSLWLQGKIKGHHIKIEEALQEWLKNFQLKPNNSRAKKRSEPMQQDLIPISIEVDVDGKKFKEVLCWNFHQDQMTPDMFARLLAQENNWPTVYEHQITQTIKRAIETHKPYKYTQGAEWIKTIQLDIRVDKINLKDKFDWDIANPANSPEKFAYQMCKQLGLNGQFCVKIAHQIREQIIIHQKSGQKDLRKTRLQNSRDWLRLQDEGWQPKIQVLDAQELKKIIKLQERKNRLIRRIK